MMNSVKASAGLDKLVGYSAKGVLGEGFASSFSALANAASAASMMNSVKASAGLDKLVGYSAKGVLGEEFASSYAIRAFYGANFERLTHDVLRSVEPEGMEDEPSIGESELLIPTPAEIVLFGAVRIDFDRFCVAVVLAGLLLPVIMSPQVAPVREWASWGIWLVPALYKALGAYPRN